MVSKKTIALARRGPGQWVKIRLHLGVGLSLDESANDHTDAAGAYVGEGSFPGRRGIRPNPLCSTGLANLERRLGTNCADDGL